MVFARHSGGDASGKISALLVPAGTPGVTVGPRDEKMGQHGAWTADVGFSDVEVPAGTSSAEILPLASPPECLANTMNTSATGAQRYRRSNGTVQWDDDFDSQPCRGALPVITTGRGVRRSARVAGRRGPCGERTPRSFRPAPHAVTSTLRRCRAY